MKETKEFLASLPFDARRKGYYNIARVQKGEKNKELFKKLENTDIWEFLTLYKTVAYRHGFFSYKLFISLIRWKCGISALAEKYISLGTKSLGINAQPLYRLAQPTNKKNVIKLILSSSATPM